MADMPKQPVNKLLPAVGTSVLCAGFLLHIVGVSTPAWMVKRDNSDSSLGEGTGMFILCDRSWQCDKHDTEPAQLMAVQGMACFGLFFASVALTLAFRHVIRSMRWGISDPEVVVNMVLLTSLVSGVLILFATIIYAMEILHKWTVGPVAVNNLKIGYSLKLSVAGAVFILIGGFVTVGWANKEETPIKKTPSGNFIFEVLRENPDVIVRDKARKTSVGVENKVSKVVREKRRSVADDRAIIKETVDSVYIHNENVYFNKARQIDLDNGYTDMGAVQTGRRKVSSRQTDLETFWETSDEELAVGEDAGALHYKRALAKRNNLAEKPTPSRKRRIGVDESAKAAVVTQEVKVGEDIRFVGENTTAPKIDYVLREKVDLDSVNKERETSLKSFNDKHHHEKTGSRINGLGQKNSSPSVMVAEETAEEPVLVSTQTEIKSGLIPGSSSTERNRVYDDSGDSHVMITKM
ncbi:hypothetical protein EGW08_018064 [Elysia chlorotica]|uniref:Uncharacterized protein n=1 Tax=Elysia chlorotica TaxID=188477 RepID=A0A3S1B3K3_ELYCH|nr:hypothetical protein EGW08_018064 [Elysia chlorotica]